MRIVIVRAYNDIDYIKGDRFVIPEDIEEFGVFFSRGTYGTIDCTHRQNKKIYIIASFSDKANNNYLISAEHIKLIKRERSDSFCD